MKFSVNNFYHVFNRGNNRQQIFLQERNYEFFVSKLKDIIGGHCNIIAYCLMPNHFHLLLFVDEASSGINTKEKSNLQILEQKLGTLQSSYTRAINNQENRTGSLFQAKVKVLQLDSKHATTCFHYIHQNPIKANLAKNFLEWDYSSYHEYINNSSGICIRDIAYNFLDIPKDPLEFSKLSEEVTIDERIISKIGSPSQ